MKWERTDLVVGFVVLGGVGALLVVLLWVSPFSGDGTYTLHTEFERVEGLGKQAPVYMNGFQVGRVGDIQPRITRDGPLVFQVTLHIQRVLSSGDSLRIPVGTRARMVPPYVMGSGFIVLEAGAWNAATLAAGAKIPGMHDTPLMEQVADMTPMLNDEVVQTLATARELMDSLIVTTGTASRTMAATSAQMAPLFLTMQQQMLAAGDLSQEIRSHLATLTPATVATIDSVQALMADSRRLMSDMNRMLVAREPEISDLMASLDSTVTLLHHTVRRVSARPYRILTGVGAPPVRVPAPASPAATEIPESCRPEEDPTCRLPSR
jgi:ABC-type transporter Mla subunit MlaD